MTRTLRGAILLCGFLLTALGSASGQNGTVVIDQVGGLKSGYMVNNGADIRFLIRYQNTTGEKCDISNGFKISSPDGAVWDSTTIKCLSSGTTCTWFAPYFNQVFAFRRYSADGVGSDTVSLIAAGNPDDPTRQMPAGYNDSVFAITVWFDGKKTSGGKHICIDSSGFPPGNEWLWVGQSLTSYVPGWQGLPGQPYSPADPGTGLGSGYCFEIYAPALQLTPPSLTFNTQPGGTPPNQTFTVASTGDGIGDHLPFTLTENAAWIVKTPVSGTTPKSITISMNTAGMGAGTYVDSIQVDGTGAANTPQWERITLVIASPAPTISINKTNLNYSAVAGGADPAAQTFIVKNTGGPTLHWTATHSSSWLSVVPTTGGDSTEVTASVSITGLGYGDYYDTITVKDTAATNDSVKVAVRLSIGSSLPLIAVDSQVNHIIVISGTNTPPPRKIYIRNAGVGAMSYSLSENSAHLEEEVPMSGTVPESVTVSFKVIGGVVGQEYRDTLWVSSPEAMNSPYPVVFHFRIVTAPASLQAATDTVKLKTYACTPDSLPTATLVINNVGNDNPRVATASYESDLFDITTDLSGNLPLGFLLKPKYPNLPVGVYYDTITVSAEFALNSPLKVIVQYTRSAGDHPPQIFMLKTNFDVIRQEQTGPVLLQSSIRNVEAGCMPWSIVEAIPWLSGAPDTGSSPGFVHALVDIDALTLGTYQDSFYVSAPGASNTPQKVKVKVRMWRFHGDNNWDGRINLVDLTWLIKYLTTGTPVPAPTYAVGDMNCDGVVNLLDLTWLVQYLTTGGPTPCGNPY